MHVRKRVQPLLVRTSREGRSSQEASGGRRALAQRVGNRSSGYARRDGLHGHEQAQQHEGHKQSNGTAEAKSKEEEEDGNQMLDQHKEVQHTTGRAVLVTSVCD